MKRLGTFCIIIFCISILNLICNSYHEEEVYIVGELIGMGVSNSNRNDTNQTIPTSYNTLGTMAFIKASNNEFVALGHSSNEYENTDVDIDCFGVKLICINKSNENEVGSIIGKINQSKKIGNIYKDTKYGVFGKVDEIDTEKYLKVKTTSRYNVKKGKANILTKISGDKLESFDAEITDIDYLDENKNIKIKVKDSNLIEKTGGIIQGMSGTPLMQDGKLIGVLNYVQANDSKCAYAVFVDKLI